MWNQKDQPKDLEENSQNSQDVDRKLPSQYNKLICLNHLTPKISLVILFTVYYTVLVMLIWRI